MKKFLVLCLAAVLLVSTAAWAESEWLEGLSSRKPYTGSPEVDFNESIGYMMLLPLNGSTVLPGKTTLQICMPREDVEVGAGTVSLYSPEQGLVEEIEITAETMVMRPMTEEELGALIWGEGAVFEIALEQPLAANEEYYVCMTEGCIVAPFYETSLAAIEDDTVWSFNTETANYVEEITFCRMVEGKDEPAAVELVQAGDMAKVSIVLGEEGVAAAVFCNAGAIKTDVTYFTESVEAVVQFPAAGDVVWGIVFFDAEGNTTYTVEYETVVAEPAE